MRTLTEIAPTKSDVLHLPVEELGWLVLDHLKQITPAQISQDVTDSLMSLHERPLHERTLPDRTSKEVLDSVE